MRVDKDGAMSAGTTSHDALVDRDSEGEAELVALFEPKTTSYFTDVTRTTVKKALCVMRASHVPNANDFEPNNHHPLPTNYRGLSQRLGRIIDCSTFLPTIVQQW